MEDSAESDGDGDEVEGSCCWLLQTEARGVDWRSVLTAPAHFAGGGARHDALPQVPLKTLCCARLETHANVHSRGQIWVTESPASTRVPPSNLARAAKRACLPAGRA